MRRVCWPRGKMGKINKGRMTQEPCSRDHTVHSHKYSFAHSAAESHWKFIHGLMADARVRHCEFGHYSGCWLRISKMHLMIQISLPLYDCMWCWGECFWSIEHGQQLDEEWEWGALQYIYIYVCVCVFVCLFVCLCVCIYIHIYTHRCIDISTCTHTHIM